MGCPACSWDLLLLAALHVLLLAAGGATVYLRFRFSSSDWPQVARAAYANDVAAFDVGMIAVGCATVAVVVVGAGAAYLRKKTLLLVEALCLLLVLGGTVFLAVRALVVYGRANDWQSSKWDAADASKNELLTADRFDALYCDAQLAFVCDHATLEQILALGLDNVALLSGADNASYSAGSTSPGATSGLCATGGGNGDDWDEICAICSGALPSYASLSSLSRWIEDNCAYSAVSTQWCSNHTSSLSSHSIGGSMSGSGTVEGGEVTGESPYAQCRTRMLVQVEDWTEALGIAWTAVCALLLLLLLCVALLIRSRANADALDLDDVAESFQQDEGEREEYSRFSTA